MLFSPEVTYQHGLMAIAAATTCMTAKNRSVLEMVLAMEEFKLNTPRNILVLKNVNLLLQASGPLLECFERIMLAMKLKVNLMYAMKYKCF